MPPASSTAGPLAPRIGRPALLAQPPWQPARPAQAGAQQLQPHLPRRPLLPGRQRRVPCSRAARPRLPAVRCAALASSGHAAQQGVGQVAALHVGVPPAQPVAPARRPGFSWGVFFAGAVLALVLQFAANFAAHTPFWQRISNRFIWWRRHMHDASTETDTDNTALVLYTDNAESVEWVNMCWRKVWRVYQRGLERWLADLLQPVFDSLSEYTPRYLQRLRILEFTLDHEAPYFSNMRRRTSRKDSDLNGVVDCRYTGGARMLLLLEIGKGRWRIKVPVLVSDLDLECKLWVKLRLAPMCPYVGELSVAFVGPPTIKVQLLPYNRVRLMRIPILQALLTRLLTVDLPSMMVLPKRLEINIPPAVTAVAEAAVGRDAVMRAVASAVLQHDALEHALLAALPLGPQSAAGGVSLPDSFHGELQVTLREARNLPVWGLPWQSNPYCRLVLGRQAVRSRRDDDTSHEGGHRAPVWNQEFTFLVEDPINQVLDIQVCDSHLTGRPVLGRVLLPLRQMPPDGRMSAWLPVLSSDASKTAQGELHLDLEYKPFEDDDYDSGYREAEAYALMLQQQSITDIKSAADASSRAAVAASAAAAAVAVTKAAAARAAAKMAYAAKEETRRRKEALESARGNGANGSNGSSPYGRDDSRSMPASTSGGSSAAASGNGAAAGPGGKGGAPALQRSGSAQFSKADLSKAVRAAVDAQLGAGASGGSPDDIAARAMAAAVEALEHPSASAGAAERGWREAVLPEQVPGADARQGQASSSPSQGNGRPASGSGARPAASGSMGSMGSLSSTDDDPSMEEFKPEMLFPGVQYRITEDDDEDSPYSQFAKDDPGAATWDSGDLAPDSSGPSIGRGPTTAAAASTPTTPAPDASPATINARIEVTGSAEDEAATRLERLRSGKMDAIAGRMGVSVGREPPAPPISPAASTNSSSSRPGGAAGEQHASAGVGSSSSSPARRDTPASSTNGSGPSSSLPSSSSSSSTSTTSSSASGSASSNASAGAAPGGPRGGQPGSSSVALVALERPGDGQEAAPAAGGQPAGGWWDGLVAWVSRASGEASTSAGAAAPQQSPDASAQPAQADPRPGQTGQQHQQEEEQSWWSRAASWVVGMSVDEEQEEQQARKRARRRRSKDAGGSYDEDDDEDGEREVVEAIVVPPDLPLEAIAEEVKASWRLKEVHVENMLQKAVAKSERPWLVLLSTLSAISICLLGLVFFRLSQLIT